jgi:hypothetical protein
MVGWSDLIRREAPHPYFSNTGGAPHGAPTYPCWSRDHTMGQYPCCTTRPTAYQRGEQYIQHQHKTLSLWNTPSINQPCRTCCSLTHTPSAKPAVTTLTKCKGAVGTAAGLPQDHRRVEADRDRPSERKGHGQESQRQAPDAAREGRRGGLCTVQHPVSREWTQ